MQVECYAGAVQSTLTSCRGMGSLLQHPVTPVAAFGQLHASPRIGVQYQNFDWGMNGLSLKQSGDISQMLDDVYKSHREVGLRLSSV